jgi:hypothetical protein
MTAEERPHRQEGTEGLAHTRAWPAQEKTSGPAVLLSAAQKEIAENDTAKAEDILASMDKLPAGAPECRGLDAAKSLRAARRVAPGRSRCLDAARHFAAAAAALPRSP